MNERLIQSLKERAAAQRRRLALPETDSPEILECAATLLRDHLAEVVLVGDPGRTRALAQERGIDIDGAEFFDPEDEEARATLVAPVAGPCGMSEKAIMRKAKKPVNAAMMLARAGRVDCVAAGRVLTTADVILAASTFVGFAPGIKAPSSMGIVDAPGFEGPEGTMIGIADCAINRHPNASQLADIAIASADTVSTLLGWEPRVAFLAFSTCGSSEDASIEMIRAGLEEARERRPDIAFDGEFQLDSAIIPEVAARKVQRPSAVAGRANVLVFPDLNAGNIGVKLIQIFGHADAYGPVMQGFACPVCDFSRSAPVSEMLGNILMLLVRAI